MQNSEPDRRSCRACGTSVPGDAPFGHCPNCLIELGFGPPPGEAKPSSSSTCRVGEYELLEQLGRGGMGVVYKARQVSLKRLVALKMLSGGAAAFPGIADRLRLEAEAAGSLHHPHIVTIYDVGEHEGQPFFTMEMIEGTGLEKCIKPDGFHLRAAIQASPGRKGKLESCIARIMIQIARAVDHAHKRGVLHRDLKPANVILDAQGEPHLTDFGLAKVLGPAATSGTASGAIMGTPSYMAPEQARGATKHTSTAADIYSLGAILYAMLTGRPPFRADNPLETLRQVVEEPPKPPSTFNHQVDRDLATICLKCLEKDPQLRYNSALALAEDLERWSRGEPIEARSVLRLERVWRWCRREPVLASLGGGLFLLLTVVALLGFSLYRREKSRGIESERQRANFRSGILKQMEADLRDPTRASVTIPASQLAAFIGREDVPGGATRQAVVLGLHGSTRQPDRLLYCWGPLVNYFYTNRPLADGPRLEVEMIIYTSRSNAVEGLVQGEVDLMFADPELYIQVRQRATRFIPLVREVYWDGRSEVSAALFTRANSRIDQLAQLRDKSFVFGEAQSALGDLLPKAQLAAAGLHLRDFLRVTNAPAFAILAAVSGGGWDAGVASLEDIAPMAQPGMPFKILSKVRSPSEAWLAREDLAPGVTGAITQALLSLSDTNVMMRLDPRLTQFQRVLPTDYDGLARDLETARSFSQPR